MAAHSSRMSLPPLMDLSAELFSSSIADYALQAPVGYGSSATVYCALYTPTNRRVAVKALDLDMFGRNQIEELRKETQVMSLCKHPNVLSVYHSFVAESKLYIVTPYLAAGSCLDIMKTTYQHGIDEISIATILKQVLQGLDYLHKNGHIHRDVKAGNVILDEDGSVFLADLGVTASLEGVDRRGQRKTFVGTPCWMAPEVMEQETGYDFRADIWSFGITALELASGHAPLAKYPPIKVLMLTLSNEPPTLDRDITKHKYSKTFKEMIDMCMQKSSIKRPSAEKLLLHPFFKIAKKKQWLVTNLLQGLPLLTQRQRKRPTEAALQFQHGVSWDFNSNTSIPPPPPKTTTTTSDNTVNTDTEKNLDTSNGQSDQLSQPFNPPITSIPEIIPNHNNITVSPLVTQPTISNNIQSEIRKGRFSVSEGADSNSPTLPHTGISLDRKSKTEGTTLQQQPGSTHSHLSASTSYGELSNVPPSQQQLPSQQQQQHAGAQLQAATSKKGRFEVSNIAEANESFAPITSSQSTYNRVNNGRRDVQNVAGVSPAISQANPLADTQSVGIDQLHKDFESLQRKADESLRLLYLLTGGLPGINTTTTIEPQNGLANSKDPIAQLTSQIVALQRENDEIRRDNDNLRQELDAMKNSAAHM